MRALERLRESLERNRGDIESALLAAGNCRGVSTIDSWLRLIAAAEREGSTVSPVAEIGEPWRDE